MSSLPPPPPQPPGPPKPQPIWKRWWVWVITGVVVLGAFAALTNHTSEDGADQGTGAGADSSTCQKPADSWLDTLQSAFYKEYRDSDITDSAYVEGGTSEGAAYYVAVEVDGVSGVAVFGTSDPPLQADPGLIAGANATATQLSDLGIDIPKDSPAGTLLLDDGWTAAAESCL